MRRPTDPTSQAIYNYIVFYWKVCGYAPTQQEIAEGVNLAYNTTRAYLLDVQSWGVIDWKPKTVRSIHITGTLE